MIQQFLKVLYLLVIPDRFNESPKLKNWMCEPCTFLNQARAGRRPARAWFLKIDPVRIVGMRVCVCVCVCPRPRLLITSGVMWRDIHLIRLVKQVLQLLYGNCSRYR